MNTLLRRLVVPLAFIVLFPLSAGASPPWKAALPSNPEGLMIAFIQADAWGLQASSGNWPQVQELTVWEDGPGWDTSTVVESAEIVARSITTDRAEFTVRYTTLGEIHTDGAGRPVLERSRAGVEQKTFKLIKTGDRWKIVEPQDQPHLAVGFVLREQIPAWCARQGCGDTPAQVFLRRWQARCAPSPIPINRNCSPNPAGSKP